MCNDNGLMHCGIFSSATLNGIRSPVSKFSTVTCSNISKSDRGFPESVRVRTKFNSSPAERLRSLDALKSCFWEFLKQIYWKAFLTYM